MESPPRTVFIIRHGQRCDVVHPSLRNSYPNPLDPSLTTLGKYQSQRTKLLINCFCPSPTSLKIVSSPFLACIETALELSDTIAIDWRFSDMFHIINYPVDISGSITCGSDWFRERFFDAEVLGQPPSFPEEYQGMKKRVIEGFDEYFNQGHEVLVVVTHLLPLEVISGYMKGEEVRLSDDGFCCATIAKSEGGKFQVILVADHTHAPQYIRS